MIFKILLRRPAILLIPRNQLLLCQRRRFTQSIWKSQSSPFSSTTPNTNQAKGKGEDEEDAASKIQERASKLIDEIEFQKHKLDEERILSPAPGIKEKVNANNQATKNEKVKEDTGAEPTDTTKKDISDNSITQNDSRNKTNTQNSYINDLKHMLQNYKVLLEFVQEWLMISQDIQK
ncbi:unnamed protein product [Ambrosiozyma monospora]|uniref:Unnamed protein product n=1 Tax=Ambrosiozyma monospora TaxID=43982 RepID=A0A9W7DIL6_AMBMO|nr:unnamed protein product [Ambrosiozyma monospora]